MSQRLSGMEEETQRLVLGRFSLMTCGEEEVGWLNLHSVTMFVYYRVTNLTLAG